MRLVLLSAMLLLAGGCAQLQTKVPEDVEFNLSGRLAARYGKDAFSGNMFADLAKRNMAMFEDASRAFTGKAKSAPEPSSSEVDELRAELAALQAKVDRLSR